jgi:hypothetical protein
MTRALLFVAIAVLTAGCSNSSSDSSALGGITAPGNAAQIVDSFSGTVQVGASDMHPFTVTAGSQPVLITLTGAGPPCSIFLGLGVGTPTTDGLCTLLTNAAVVVQASSTAQLSGTISAGSYCVAVFDVGNQTGPVDYAVTVSHF